MYEVTVKDHFSAAHQLRACGGVCENLHGHNWKVDVVVESQKLDSIGVVVDFKVVEDATKEVLDFLDHQILNKIPYFQDVNPSEENIARYFFKNKKKALSSHPVQLKKVTVWETDLLGASYSEN